MSDERPASVDRLVFQTAWRLKHLVRPWLPAAARQGIGRALFRRAYAMPPPGAETRPPARAAAGRRGLNVIGYLRAESGVAEAARATLRACRAGGVPAAAIEYTRESPSRMEDEAPSGFPSAPEFPVTLLHLNADQSAFAIVDHADALDGRYRIACWNWELPEFPARWPEAERLLDEVWAPSTSAPRPSAAACGSR